MYKRVSYILFLVSLLACEVHKENKEEVKKDTIVTAIPEPDTSVSEPVKTGLINTAKSIGTETFKSKSRKQAEDLKL